MQIFMLATISRSNAKNVGKRRSITHTQQQQAKKVKFKEAISYDIHIYDSNYYSMCLNIVYQTQVPKIALTQRRYNVMTI